MDQLPAFGTAIADVVGPTLQLYQQRLSANAPAIRHTRRTTHQYGPGTRQVLDLYHPTNPSPVSASTVTPNSAPAILVFLYGGGLVRGSRRHVLSDASGDLVYANIGHWFAANYGLVVVIPDYRLVPHSQYPGGGQDVADCLEWLLVHTSELDQPSTSAHTAGAARDLFIMGNSAGGVHLTTWLLDPAFDASRAQVLRRGSADPTQGLCLKALVLLAVPLHFRACDRSRKDVLEAYYGHEVEDHCPLGLLMSAKEEGTLLAGLNGLKVLMLTSTLDPEDEILQPNRDFAKAWPTSSVGMEEVLAVDVIDGHNHISPVLSLGTGDEIGEAWGHKVASFLNRRRQS